MNRKLVVDRSLRHKISNINSCRHPLYSYTMTHVGKDSSV